MTTELNPALGVSDNARQAMEFYHSVIGGDLMLNTFADMPASVDKFGVSWLLDASVAPAGSS